MSGVMVLLPAGESTNSLGGRTIHGLIRRALFWYIFFVILAQQGTFVLVAGLGLDFDPAVMVWVLPAIIPISAMVWRVVAERDRLAMFALEPWPLWVVTGVLLFSFWSGGYFLVGFLTDPARATLLPPEFERFDRFVPFSPSFVFLYLTVYPAMLLPFLHARRPGVLVRYAIGTVVMLLISYVIFLLMPVAFPRPSLPEPWSSFPVWVLKIVHGQDPPWNCLPSTHCAVALLSALALYETNRRLGVWAFATAFSIATSTVFTKQHYIVDALAGFALAGITYWAVWWIWQNPDRLPEAARRISTGD